MRAGGTNEQRLEPYVCALEVGHYDRILSGGEEGGPAAVARDYPLVLLVARAQADHVRGDLDAVQRALSTALRWLPHHLLVRAADGQVRVVLPVGFLGTFTSARLARLVWREQRELDDLRERAAEMTARDALVEAFVELLVWADCDPFYRPVPGPADAPGVPVRPRVDRTRGGLCGRASHLRQLGKPTAGSVSSSVWSQAGGHDGLSAAALDALADRAHAVPWWGEPGTEGLPVRRGRLRAKEHADRLRADRNAWA